MASELGRGAQVLLDDRARQLARGGTTGRLIDSIREKAALEAGGTVADGNRPDGSSGDGTPANDDAIFPGGSISAVTPYFAPTGTGGVARTLQAEIADYAFPVARYGAVGDGATDDRAAIQNALNARAAAGGGTVLLGPHRYYVGSDLSVPTNVTLEANYWAGGERSGTDYSTTPYTIVLASTARLLTGWNAAIRNLVIQRQGLTRPSGARASLDAVRAFAGTAVKVNGSEALLENLFIIGFNLAIDNSGFERAKIRNIEADCTNGILIDNNHDVSHLYNLHFFPFVTVHQSGLNNPSHAISAVADNGAGLIRITLATHPYATGDRVNVLGVGGVTAALGRWTITVINSTTIDLQGSTFSGTYTSGGTVNTGINARDGYGVKVTNSEAMVLADVFDFGHTTGFWLSDAAGWTQLFGCGSDFNLTDAVPGSTSLLIDSTSYGTSWIAGWTSSAAYSVIIDNSSATSAHKISSATLNSASTYGGPIWVKRGRAVFSGCNVPHSGSVTVSSTATSVIFSGCDFPNLALTNSATAGVVQSDFSTRFLSGGAIQSISLGAAGMASTSALVIAGSNTADTNQGAQIKVTNTTSSGSVYQRVSAGSNLEWLGTSYTLLARLSQAGTFSAQDLGVLGTKAVSFVLAGPASGSAAAPTWRQLVAADVSGAAPAASPTLTGTPLSTTAAVDTNTTQIATTAFVLAQAAAATPIVNGSAAVGTSTRFARADHVHPTDTTLAPLASPPLTGAVTIGSASANGGSNTPLWVRGNPTADTSRGGEIRMTNPNAGSPDWWQRVTSAGTFQILNNAYASTLTITQAGVMNLLLGGMNVAGALSIRPGTSVTPAANGDLVFEATSDTQVKVKLKGSDGTVRSVTLTLA
jgi:hypothetical protein